GDLPAHRLPVRERAERVSGPRCVGTIAPERTDLLAPVGVPQPQAVAGRLQVDPRPVDPLDEPVPPLEADDLARRERLLARVRMHALRPGAGDVDELVGDGHGEEVTPLPRLAHGRLSELRGREPAGR